MRSEIQKAIVWAGGKTRLAVECGVTERSVENWVRAGKCPRTAALLLESLSEGRISADRLSQGKPAKKGHGLPPFRVTPRRPAPRKRRTSKDK